MEKGPEKQGSPETNNHLIVRQPEKLEGLLESISLMSKSSEISSEDHSGDMGGSGGFAGTSGQSQISLRAQAIANLPVELTMKKELVRHIEREVEALQKEVRRAAKRASQPGNAYKLNQLYARIRRLNSLLAHVLEASYDMVKRLFIRIFIDKQPVL